MSSPCGVVVVGMGIAGKVRVRDLGQANLWPETKHVKLIGFVSRREMEIEGVKQLTLEDALQRDDVHVVIIATENKSHYDIAKKSLEAGKHVLVEFPLATTAKLAEELQSLAKEKGLFCHEEVISLLLEGHDALREDIQKRPPLVEGKITLSASYNGWIEKFGESGSPFTTSIFLMHSIVDVFGEVSAQKATLHVDDKGYSCSGVVHTKDGKPITIEVTRTAEKSPRAKTIYFKFEDGSVIDEMPPSPNAMPLNNTGPGLFMKDFIQFQLAYDSNKPLIPTSRQSLHCHQVADQLYDLAKKD